MLQFEYIKTNVGDTLRRAAVPGGWLVTITSDAVHGTPWEGLKSGWDWRTSITFVPDPMHEWEVNND